MNEAEQIVFVVHGDAHVRASLDTLLTTHGLRTLTFECAAQYLEYARPDLPTCLILDVELPDANGLDLQREVECECPAVVFVTSSANVAHSVRAIKAGAADFLTIPFDQQELLTSVRMALACQVSERHERQKLEELRQRSMRLTRREREVMSLVVSGMTNKQVASELSISEVTVQVHRGRVMQKMQAKSFADLVRFAEMLSVPLSVASHLEARLARSHGRAGSVMTL